MSFMMSSLVGTCARRINKQVKIILQSYLKKINYFTTDNECKIKLSVHRKSAYKCSLHKILCFSQLLAHKAPVVKQLVRNLEVHEHIAYTLLKGAGIPTPPFWVARTPDEAADLAKNLKTKDLVLKAQVLAGGRAKGQFKDSNVSGVVMCDTWVCDRVIIYSGEKPEDNGFFRCSAEQVQELASSMIGKVLVTKQTGAAGKICNSVMVTARMFPRREYYMAVMLERTFDVSMNTIANSITRTLD